MRSRPTQLLYDRDEIPPWRLIFLLGFQHLLLGFTYLVYPLVFLHELGLEGEVQQVLTMALLVTGIGSILQSVRLGPIGSGQLGIHTANPIYLPLAIQAGKAGGLPLAFGMILVTGFIESVLSRFYNRLQRLFPPHVCGVVIMMLGLSMIRPALVRLTGYDALLQSFSTQGASVGLFTLALIVGLSVWSKRLRLFALLIGLVTGYGLCAATGLMPLAAFQALHALPVFALPTFQLPSLRFDPVLLFPCLVTAIAASVDVAGMVIVYQKMNDAEWRRADMHNAGNGILADGIGSILAGFLGTLGTGFSSANVGLSLVVSVCSRIVGITVGILCILTAFFPIIPATIAAMPGPIMGAALAYAATFLIASGCELITARILDVRRIFTISLAVIGGLSVSFFPELHRTMPAWIGLLAGSPMILATAIALGLNALFQLGISQKIHHTINIAEWGQEAHDQMRGILEQAGMQWGLRRDVVRQADFALTEFLDALPLLNVEGPMEMGLSFNEYRLDVRLVYRGQPIPLATGGPTGTAILEDDAAFLNLAGRLIQHHATKCNVLSQGGVTTFQMQFDH